MKISLDNLVALVNFIELHKNEKISFQLAYKFNKILAQTECDIKFFREKYGELLLEYSIKNDNNEPIIEKDNIKIDPERIGIFNEKMLELLSTEIDFPDIYFNFSELECFKISISELKPLMDFIKE